MTTAKRATSKAKNDAVPQRTYADLGKLRKASLKRYKKHFKLDCKADSKTELLEAVMRHFAQMPVREEEVALEFHNFRRSMRGRQVLSDSAPRTVEHSQQQQHQQQQQQTQANGTTSTCTPANGVNGGAR